VSNYVINADARIIIINIFCNLFSTVSDKKDVIITHPEQIESITDILISACTSQNLMLTVKAIDAFYEIYSEANYNQILLDKQVI